MFEPSKSSKIQWHSRFETPGNTQPAVVALSAYLVNSSIAAATLLVCLVRTIEFPSSLPIASSDMSISHHTRATVAIIMIQHICVTRVDPEAKSEHENEQASDLLIPVLHAHEPK